MFSNELKKIMDTIFCEGSILMLLNSLTKGIIVIDKNERIVYINRVAENYIQNRSNLSNWRNKRLYDFIEIEFNRIRDVLSKGMSFFSIKNVIKGRTFYLNISPIELNLNIIGAVVVFEESNSLERFLDTFKLCISINREVESVFSSSYDEIIITDNQGKVLKINAACEKIYNLKATDIVGKNVTELEKSGVFNPSVTLKVIKEKKRVSLTQKTNTGRVLIVCGNPVFDSNSNLIQVISTSKDITEIYELKEKLKETEKLVQKYYYELEELKQSSKEYESIVYKSQQMKTLMSVVEKVARVDSNILLIGESGVGKGLIAETIHKLSNRSNNNFVNINCGAIPETLLESELFGYEKGAFTGANREGKIGQIELADKGTLFLDEISELPLQMQVKLLKVINEKKFIRVGGTKTVTSDFRLIAATNKDLRRLVKEGKFREDLFYRLNVVPISIPPLRERKEDIIVLVKYFLEKYNKRYNVSKKISPEAFDVFLEYNWPGNVRELENCIERIVVTVDKDIIDLSDLPGFLFKPFQDYTEPTELLPLKKAVEQTERQLIIKAYKLYKNTYKVANILGISQPTVVRKLKKYKQEVSDN
jgi:PAS domain S-box-containing protein